ncbi:MAG: hypothetical protein H6Q54_996 [Deltaproteobacteria bacterium]|nr:hypothetical protein [Deltaproteobacteria bacterium]
MKIEFTQKQYEALLKIVYLGSWMASSTKEEPAKEYEKIEQYVLSFAKDFKMEKFVGFDKKLKSYYPSEEFEDATDVIEQIDAYDEYKVWETLVLSLSHRDIVKKYGEKKVEQMSEEEVLEKEYPLIQKYEEEFREHGFDNLYVRSKK